MSCFKRQQLREMEEVTGEADDSFSFGNPHTGVSRAPAQPTVKAQTFPSKNELSKIPPAMYRYLRSSAHRYSGMSEKEQIHYLKEEKFQLQRRVNQQELMIERLSRTLDQQNKFFVRRLETMRNSQFYIEKSAALMGSTMAYQSLQATLQMQEQLQLPVQREKQQLYMQFDRPRRYKSSDAGSSQTGGYSPQDLMGACNMSAIANRADLSLNDAGDELAVKAQEDPPYSGGSPDLYSQPLSLTNDDAPAVDVMPIDRQSNAQTPRILRQTILETVKQDLATDEQADPNSVPSNDEHPEEMAVNGDGS